LDELGLTAATNIVVMPDHGFFTISKQGTTRQVVNFRSFDTVCGVPMRCGIEVADTALQQGQGMHTARSAGPTPGTSWPRSDRTSAPASSVLPHRPATPTSAERST